MPTNNALNITAIGLVKYDGAGTFTATTTTNHNLLIGSTSNAITNVAPSATSGVAVISQGAAADPTFGTVVVAGGGTGTTTLTNHGVLIGQATSAITATAAGSAGQVLQSGGAAADPTYSTATFPSTATGTGTILRADGTNWVATTATYPATTTSQQILYSTAANVIGQLTTANSALAATNSSGTLAMRLFSVVIQTFTSNGTYTPTSGMLYCVIEIVGSGGGGGGCAATTAAQFSAASGGAGGEYARGIFSAATVGASQTVTCPAGGAGGTAGANNGTAGSTTSVGALITALGGGNGLAGTATTGASNAAGSTGGTGGTGGSFRCQGGPGSPSFCSITGGILLSGTGGVSIMGTGALARPTSGDGVTGGNYGSGGSGAANSVSQSARAGGTGGGGLVVITEYVIA